MDLGAKIAIDGMATATSTTTTAAFVETSAAQNEPASWDELTNAEKAWCARDRGTWFAVFRAVETLGFYDFSTSLYDDRDGELAQAIGEQADGNERWAEQQGESERDRRGRHSLQSRVPGSSGDRQ